MVLLDPLVILFGSPKTISTIRLRFPISFVLAIDESSLESLVNVNSTSSDTLLQEYFIILLDSINNELLDRLQLNNHVRAIYHRQPSMDQCDRQKLYEIKNKSWQQFEFNLALDIIALLTFEGTKQIQLENLSLTQIYYRQARTLKEWTMSFLKAEVCHILIIPLNTSQENLTNSYERLQNICIKLGYPSMIIHTLDEYIFIDNNNQSNLIPYSQALFKNENPQYICGLIKKLSPIRLYLYGNKQSIQNEWSKLMMQQETDLMNDEDNWFTFIENELINNDIKWNIASMFGENLKIKRLTPINLNDLDKNLQFDSAVQQSIKTYPQRQIQVTADIFYWFDNAIKNSKLQLNPKLTDQQQEIATNRNNSTDTILTKNAFQYSLVPEGFRTNLEDVIFIWLDENPYNIKNDLHELIKPSPWCFFNDISSCLKVITDNLDTRWKIFFVVSNSLGYKLSLTSANVMRSIPFLYVYCSESDLNHEWTNNYLQSRRVCNDSSQLIKYIKQDLCRVYQRSNINWNDVRQSDTNNTLSQTGHLPSTSISFIVHKREEADDFLAYHRTIDQIIAEPHTSEFRDGMMIEFCRVFNDDSKALYEIGNFYANYNPNDALRWYSLETFLFGIINRTLRSKDRNAMYQMRYIIKDLYTQLEKLYQQSLNDNSFHQQTIQKVYRGQRMSHKEFEYLQQIQGEVILMTTFLSTTESFQVALCFGTTGSSNNDMISVIFCIEINRSAQSNRPYANISEYSNYQEEAEVLFSMGSTFRIQNIEIPAEGDNFHVVYLTLIDPKELQ